MNDEEVKKLFEPEYYESATSQESEFHDRIKSLALYLLEIEEVKTENDRKQFYFLLEQLLREKLEKITTKESKVILGCCLLEIFRLVSPKLKLTEIKSNLFYKLLLAALKSFDETVAPGQFYYLIESVQKTDCMLQLQKQKDKFDLLSESIRQLLRLDAIMSVEPGSTAKIQQIILSVIKNSDEQQLTLKIFPELVISIFSYKKSTKQGKNVIKQLLNNLVNGFPVQLRINFQKYLNNVIRERRKTERLQNLEFKDILLSIYRSFKINHEMMLDIVPYLEEGISGKGYSEDRKVETIYLYGKICCFKNSIIAVTCPNVFKHFLDSLTDKKSTRREEMLQLSLKFLARFCFNYEKQRKSPNSLSSQDIKIINCLKNTEEKLLSVLLDPKDKKFRHYAVSHLERFSIQQPFLLTKGFFKEILENLYKIDPSHKLTLISFLINIFKHYCLKLHRENIFDYYDSSQSFNLVNGRLSVEIADRKEKAQEFQWLGWRLFSTFLEFPNSDGIISILSFNSMFFDDECSVEENINMLMGFFYNLEQLAYTEYAFSHSKNQIYEEFLGKALGDKWIGQYENIFKTKSLFYAKTFLRSLRLKRKLAVLSDKRLHREGINEQFRASLDEKIYKYANCAHIVDSKEIIKKVEQLAASDAASKRHMETLMKPISSINRKNIEERKREKTMALDYLARAINIENSDFILRALLCNETVDPKYIDLYLDKVLKYFQRGESDNGPVLAKSLFLESSLKLLLELRDVFSVQFSPENIENLVNLLSSMIKFYSNYVEMSKKNQQLAEESIKNTNQVLSPNQVVIDKSKMESFAHLEMSLLYLLRLLSKLRLNRHYPATSNLSSEELKELLHFEMKNNTLTAEHAKYGTKLIKALDTITSKRILPQMFKSTLSALELKGFFLLKNINIISVFMFDVDESDFELESQEQEQLIGFYHTILEKTVSLPRSHIISEITLAKKKLMKIVFNQLYVSSVADVISKSASKLYSDRNKFYSSLLNIITNSGDILAGNLSADREYMRVNALKLVFEIISSKDFREDRLGETLAKLSLCCFDNNPDIRKIMLNYILKFGGGKRRFESQYMVLLCLFLCDEDRTINCFALTSLTACISSFRAGTAELMRNKSAKIRAVIEKSAEFWLVYLFFIFLNNPLFLFKKMEMRNVYKIMKAVFDILLHPDEKNKENFSETDYLMFQRHLMVVLFNLRGKIPVIHRDIAESSLQFYEVKVKLPKEVKTLDAALENEKVVKINVPDQSSSTNRAQPQPDKKKVPDHDYESAFNRLIGFCEKLLESQYSMSMPSASSWSRSDLKKIELNIPQELYQNGYDPFDEPNEQNKESPAEKEDNNKQHLKLSTDPPPLQEIPLDKLQAKRSKRKMVETFPSGGKKRTVRMKK